MLWTLRPRVHFRGIAVADEDPLASREQEYKRYSHDQLAPVEQVLRAGREIWTRDRSAFACRYHVFILWLENLGSRQRCFGVTSFLMVYQPLYVRQESR